jgi:hypothetical protein
MDESATAVARLVKEALAELLRNPPAELLDAICARVGEREAAQLAAIRIVVPTQASGAAPAE